MTVTLFIYSAGAVFRCAGPDSSSHRIAFFVVVFFIVVHVDSILVSLRDNVSVVALGSAQNPCTSSSFIFLIVR